MTAVIFITENRSQTDKNTDRVTNEIPSQYKQYKNHKRKWRITVKPRIMVKPTAVATARPTFIKLKKTTFIFRKIKMRHRTIIIKTKTWVVQTRIMWK